MRNIERDTVLIAPYISNKISRGTYILLKNSNISALKLYVYRVFIWSTEGEVCS